MVNVCGLIWFIRSVFLSFYNWARDRLSYNASLRHIFRTLQKVRKERGQKDLSTLDVHVVSRRPMYHCDPWWGIFMYDMRNQNKLTGQWPSGVKKLNLTFIVQQEDDAFKKTIGPEHKCGSNRVITYALKHMLYHMYYSSDEYIEPDAVVILDNYDTMLRKEDELHRDISYRNITSKARTALILVDRIDEQLDRGVKAVNEARPVDKEHSEYVTSEYSRYKFVMLRRKNDIGKRK